MRIWTVGELTRYIKAVLDGDEALGDLWVTGEVSNFTRAASGHWYFTLKDSDSELRCVMWRGQASRLGWVPRSGDRVEGHGQVSVYERGGVYQFYAETLQQGGVGALWLAFEELRRRLQAEGLFAPERKRPLPAWPHRIGVVTSGAGAALQDILKVLRARYPLAEVVLAPSAVQGEQAPAELVQALDRLNRQSDIDVVIVARGGGSLEDLWAFNDERVARAIVASRAPVVTGIGHEVDFTIADFVADLRAPTPTAAAAAIVPDVSDLRSQLRECLGILQKGMARRFSEQRDGLLRMRRRLALGDPRRALAEKRQRLDDLAHRAVVAWEHAAALWQMRLGGQREQLHALDPSKVLQRGYALVRDRTSGQVIARIVEARPSQGVLIHLRDGRLGATVTEVLDSSGVLG